MLVSNNKKKIDLTKIFFESRGLSPINISGTLKKLKINSMNNNKYNPSFFKEKSFSGPELHPLDYEWYFNQKSVIKIVNIVKKSKGDVLCIGCPTIAAALSKAKVNCILIDKNDLIKKRIYKYGVIKNAIIADINSTISLKDKFNTVIFDSPWYLDSFLIWLLKSISFVKDGGSIYFSLFPEKTRSSAEKEREIILQLLSKFGKYKIYKNYLTYETPLFEKYILLKYQMHFIKDWRYSDFVEMKIAKDCIIKNAQKSQLVDHDWDRVLIGNQVVKIKRDVERKVDYLIKPVTGSNNFSYGNISLSNEKTAGIELWSSRNNVAKISNSEKVLTIMKHIAALVNEKKINLINDFLIRKNISKENIALLLRFIQFSEEEIKNGRGI